MSLLSFIMYCVIVTFTPGPSNIVILASAGYFGIRSAMKYVWGATLAFAILLAASALLNHMLAAALPGILRIMQIIGSLYMLYLAYQVYHMNVKTAVSAPASSFTTGLLMQFVNPKVILFTLTVLPGYVLPYYQAPSSIWLFVGLVTLIGFLAYSSWAAFGGLFRSFLERHQKVMNIVMALFLVYSAIAVSSLI